MISIILWRQQAGQRYPQAAVQGGPPTFVAQHSVGAAGGTAAVFIPIVGRGPGLQLAAGKGLAG